MTRYMKLSWERTRRRDVKRAREKKRERQKKGGWRKLGLGLMKSSCWDYVRQYEMNARQLNHQGVKARVFICTWTDLTFSSVWQWVLYVCQNGNRVHVSWSTDVCVCVCVCMGKASILDKHLLMTLRAWELQLQRQKRDRGLFIRREKAADKAD